MTPKLKILASAYSRISSLTKPTYGGVFGVIYDRTLLITGVCVDDSGNMGKFLSMQDIHPTGIDFCGVLLVTSPEGYNETEVAGYLKDVSVTDNPVFLKICADVGEPLSAYFFCNERLCETTFSMMSLEEFSEVFVPIRLQTTVQLVSEISREALSQEVDELQKLVSSGAFVFHFTGTECYLRNDVDEESQVTLGEIYAVGEHARDPRLTLGLLLVETFILATDELDHRTSPSVTISGSNTTKVKANLPVDALCLAPKNRLIINSYGLFVDTLNRALRLLEKQLGKSLKDPERIGRIRQYHFLPSPIGHFLTLLYDCEGSEEATTFLREKLHLRLCLPLNVPYLRRSNALQLNSQGGPLVNVHEGLKPSGIKGGTISLVQGHYLYYHYMMGGINDDGWGCAYRSLQTVFSWFKLQGYTSKPVPTHREIQQVLIDIKDKPKDFLGSKQWIGSLEVSFVLDTLLGLTCRTLNVSSGSEMSTIGSELEAHFSSHGTPVMIGGGVLAHTILGVHYDRDSGSLKFLVLDPHYTGEDNLKTIQGKGWVGWKGTDFWSKGSYYNLCLPYKPSTF